jgi:hypothetical protein
MGAIAGCEISSGRGQQQMFASANSVSPFEADRADQTLAQRELVNLAPSSMGSAHALAARRIDNCSLSLAMYLSIVIGLVGDVTATEKEQGNGSGKR